MNNLKLDLTKELRGLLKEWDVMQVNPVATQRDFVRMKDRIDTICAMLNNLDR